MIKLGFLFLLAVGAISATPTSPECKFDLELANQTQGPLQAFYVKLHRKISEQNPDKNIVFSPVSIVLALALTEAGAGGQTQTELRRVLAPAGFNGDVGTLYQALQHQLRIQQDTVKLSLANGLFYDDQFALKPDYLARVKKCFQTEIDKVDFGQSEAARTKINSWVSDNTAQKIPELLKPGVLSGGTKAVLANAIYLKAAWQKAFDSLEDHKFYSLASQEKAATVKFMVRTGSYNYAGNDDYEMLEIPYRDAPISMIIVKSKANTGIPALVAKLEATQPRTLWRGASRKEVAVKLPRFTIRLPTDLTSTLSQLGLASMFSSAADFGRMVEPANALKVSNVVHEAFIKVNENGTEAAAATAVVFERTMVVPRPETPIPFTVDHPFLFGIVHHPTGATLFSGTVNTVDQSNNS